MIRAAHALWYGLCKFPGMVTDKELYVATIARLLDDFGGYSTVANILNVSVDDLQRWSVGKARPPSGIFFRMLHLAEGA